MTEEEEFAVQVKALHEFSAMVGDAVRKAYEAGWNDHATFATLPQHEKVKSVDGDIRIPFLENWRRYENRNK